MLRVFKNNCHVSKLYKKKCYLYFPVNMGACEFSSKSISTDSNSKAGARSPIKKTPVDSWLVRLSAINFECEAAFRRHFPAHQASRPTNFAFPPASAGQKSGGGPAVGGNLACITHDRIAKRRGRNLRRSLSRRRRVGSNNNEARAPLSTSQPPAFFIWGRIVKGAAGAITRINKHTQAREKCARMPATALPRPLALSAPRVELENEPQADDAALPERT